MLGAPLRWQKGVCLGPLWQAHVAMPGQGQNWAPDPSHTTTTAATTCRGCSPAGAAARQRRGHARQREQQQRGLLLAGRLPQAPAQGQQQVWAWALQEAARCTWGHSREGQRVWRDAASLWVAQILPGGKGQSSSGQRSRGQAAPCAKICSLKRQTKTKPRLSGVITT